MSWQDERRNFPTPRSAWDAIVSLRNEINLLKSQLGDAAKEQQAQMRHHHAVEESLIQEIKQLEGFVSELQSRLRSSNP